MASVVLKTEEEQTARVTPLPPVPAAPAFVEAIEAVETSTAVPVAPLASVSAASSRRYDQATIEKALAVAMQMQQEHQATLSTEQVVRLGEEVNVDPAFMLRALAQIDGTTEAALATAPPKQTQTSSLRLALSPLPLISRYTAVVVPFLFAIVSYCVFTAPATRLDSSNNLVALIWMFGGGSLLALLLGVGLRRLRLGLLSGFCVGFFLALSATIATIVAHHMPLGDFFLLLCFFTAAGTALGLAGAATPRMYRRAVIALMRQFPHLAEEAR